MMQSVNILVPLEITDATLTSSTIAEPAAGETDWVSSGTYVAGDLRIRSTTHQVYKCVQGHTGRTALPEADSAYWLAVYATQKWAMFDAYASTQSVATTTMTAVLRPGIVNAVAVINADAYTATLVLKDAPGGTVVDTRVIDMQEYPLDWYDWAFGAIQAKTKVVFDNLMIYADPEISVTLASSSGVTVKCGLVAVGDYRNLLDAADFGGAQYSATASPTTFSYIKTDEYGNTVIKRRGSASDMRVQVILPKANSDAAFASLQSVLDVPVIVSASQASGYSGLTVFGLASGSMNYSNSSHDVLSLDVKGML